ncbi:hypothetical protein OCV70_17790 [Blautia acetigignens]|uniref:hypothetical protein n=1 Tax=Blautia acetigignens TaxID=2981783 RepID=UPI00189F1607|nr:hypothetical protein [Blautia acetigignens]MCU6776448.1 hypothetical protein [Blautia acetigignens]
MKRRYLAVLMGVMVATTSVPAMVYAENVKTERAADEASDESSEKADGSDENAQSDEAEENVVLGEVKSVSDTEITIAVGTMKEMGQPGGNGQGQTITITENTVITKQSGGMQQGQTGGDGQNGGVPEKPDGNGQGAEAEEISLSDIQEGDIVSITLDEDGNAASITVMSMEMSGQSQGVDSYTAVNEYTEDTTVSGETLESTGTDENAALISSGASVTLDNDTITRTSDSSTGGDNSSFYGVGAAVLATDGTAYVKDGSVTTDAAGGAGLFAYGDGTVYASGTTVKTTQDTSGGVHVAGGGTLYGWDLDVETNGESSAAIRSDRGGGTMVIDGGNYVSNGVGSPAIYSTADIAVSNASLTANGSEAVCIEGLNSIHLYDCDLTGNMSDLDQNDNTWTVILYQSMSGDSEVGNSTFQMDGGSLTSENGGVFYTTNTESTITLSNVDINYNDDNEFFLQCTGNTNQRGWGQSGANGADCHFTGISQDMQGNVIWDSISDLDFYLTEGSSLTGAVVDDETYAGEGGGGYCNIYVSSDSTWNVTGDSTVSALENEGTIVDSEGKTVTIQGTDGTVYVQGDSEYTITTGSYSDSVDLSGATSIQDQSAYTVEKPDQL